MKRFRFGLDRVLKVKQQRERIAEAKLAQARQALDLAQERIRIVAQEIARLSVSLEKLIGSVLLAETWAVTFEQSNQLARALREAEAALAAAQKVFEDAALARRQIATEVEALKTLRQQQWEEHRDETRKVEQERLDELGMRRWSGEARPGT